MHSKKKQPHHQGQPLIRQREFPYSLIARRFSFFLSPLLLLLAPSFAFAATFSGLVTKILALLNKTVPVLIGLAVLLFAYGVFRYIGAGGDEKRLSEGKQLVLWGVIALFVTVSFWGLVNLLLNTFFTSGETGSFNLSDQLFNFPNP